MCATAAGVLAADPRTMAQVSLTKANLHRVTKFVITRCRTRL